MLTTVNTEGHMILDGLAAITLLGHSDSGQATSNTFHISDPGAGDPPDFPKLAGLAEQFTDMIHDAYIGIGVPQWTWDETIAKQVSDGIGSDTPLSASFTVNEVGERPTGTPHVPEGLCGVISIKTAVASRRFRGHVMLPPVIKAGALNGNFLATGDDYWMNMGPICDALKDGAVGGGGWSGADLADYTLVVFSRTAAGQSEPSVAQAIDVIRRAKVSFLRRRERGSS